MWFNKYLGLEFNGNNGGTEVLTSNYLCHIFNDLHVKEKQELLLSHKYIVAIVRIRSTIRFSNMSNGFSFRFIPFWNK